MSDSNIKQPSLLDSLIPVILLVVMMGGGWEGMDSERTLDGFTITYEVDLPRADGGLAEPASIRVYDRDSTPGGRP